MTEHVQYGSFAGSGPTASDALANASRLLLAAEADVSLADPTPDDVTRASNLESLACTWIRVAETHIAQQL